ncbi:hypothetical protein IL45_04720 [Nonlabens ulvanivorans]|uniref:Uncharacterized protein n=1 Tax=Nonlabens ulvanivorans TaxID=906888 RepID=A0A084JX35_NONUL|nr:hypothetical protein [Nonlabens ulvanivorans]KEZ93519.1 hypothetical protein IL45_04720 [Nonlabens ulvanivorans]
MEISTIIKILLLVKNNGNISELLKDGYTYGQIARMTNECMDEGFLEKDVNQIKVSTKGLGYLDEKFAKKNKFGSESWIVPEEKSKIMQLGKNEIYLPNRKELDF